MSGAIQNALDVHRLGNVADYAAAHARAVAKLQAAGQAATVHEVTTAIAARINWGRWIVECPCGAAAAVLPLLGVSRCFGCGAVYTNVTLPGALLRALIERILTRRRRARERNWIPGESGAVLSAENLAHGVEAE